jgi:two-component system chemotaxis response regulator CheY
MKTLIVEDDFTSRLLLQEILKGYGVVHVAVNGREAVEAVEAALNASEGYDLICLDIMMPEMDGYKALEEIRDLERARGMNTITASKILMTSALHRIKDIGQAFHGLCDAYLVKPIGKAKVLAQLHEFGLI